MKHMRDIFVALHVRDVLIIILNICKLMIQSINKSLWLC